MATTQLNGAPDVDQRVRDRFSGALRRQAEQIEKLGQILNFLKNEQQQLEEVVAHLTEPIEQTATDGRKAEAMSASGILSSVRKLAAAAYAEQVLALLAEEAAGMGIRAVVFDVRGRGAWGCAAGGFEPELSVESVRMLVIPLNHQGPFQEVLGTGEALETTADSLAMHGKLMAKISPAANARVLLIPVRFAGSISAVIYAEIGERRDPILIDSLKLLAEFAGAQIDRLMALNEGYAEDGSTRGPEQRQAAPGQPAEACAAEETTAVPKQAPVPPGTAELAGRNEATAGAESASHLSEDEEQRIHRDAQRFSKLLVTEIELYNKSGVEEGRRNKDLYQRLKKDIDRSRETYKKRFAKTVANKVDYFHEELVRRLADNDPALLGSGYPGPSV